jgi:hypothetical protein
MGDEGLESGGRVWRSVNDQNLRRAWRVASRRASFHTSPQLSQRQYVLASGFFSVVTIAED